MPSPKDWTAADWRAFRRKSRADRVKVRTLGDGSKKKVVRRNVEIRDHNMQTESLDLIREIAARVEDLSRQVEFLKKQQDEGDSGAGR